MHTVMRQICTEARSSIRESLLIFNRIRGREIEALAHDYSLRNKSSYTFTKESSCGNFLKIFTGLFISRREVTRTGLESIIDGSALFQYTAHPNISLHSLLSPESHALYSKLSQLISNFSSTRGHKLLSAEIMQYDDSRQLPRIFLVSVTWAFPTAHIKDHKFVIIKHSNQHFSISQNYIAGQARLEQRLEDWYVDTNTIFSSREGFDKGTMENFLSRLFSFASSQKFSSVNNFHMFGVLHTRGDGETYWPSVSHREIHDSVIFGYGHRCMANDLVSAADSRKANVA